MPNTTMPATTVTQTRELTSLTDWARSHISQVFEAPTPETARNAIEQTFSQDLGGTHNGTQLTIERMHVAADIARSDALGKPIVQWRETVEAVHDPASNRVRVY